MYGKLFRQMYRGSMCRAGWEAIVTMQQMIVLADRHGEVDMTPEAIAAETTIPLEVILKGISTLEQPDPDSRTPDEEGRRIVRLSERRTWGWRVVNYAMYRELRDENDRREYHRQYWHKRKTQQNSTALNTTQSNSTNADADADADAEAKKKPLARKSRRVREPSPAFDEIRAAYPKRAGGDRLRDARSAYEARLREGATHAMILDGVRRYAAFCEATDKIGTPFVQQLATFLGTNRGYLELWTIPRKPETTAERKAREQREVLRKWASGGGNASQ